MASSGSSIYTPETLNNIRIRQVFDLGSKNALLKVLDWVAPHWDRSEMQTFEDHLKTNTSMKVKFFKEARKKDQREVMRKDPEGKTWDVSLIYILIRYGNEVLADKEDPAWNEKGIFPQSLESLITAVKDERNNAMHIFEPMDTNTFVNKLENIRQLLEDTICLAGHQCRRNQSEIDQTLTEVNQIIFNCRDDPLEPKNFEDYKKQLLFQQQRKQVEQGKEELIATLAKYNSLSPVSLLLKVSLPVNEVFTKMVLIGNFGRNVSINMEEILIGDKQSITESIILIQGVAGIGKTSLMKKLLYDYRNGKKEIIGLEKFDILLHAECREHTDSVMRLLAYSMPKTSKKFKGDDIINVLTDFRLLLILDGIDELNVHSTKLFQEFLHLKEKCDNITLLITARPEAVHKYYQSVQRSQIETKHVVLEGIPPERRDEFVRKYHEGIDKKGLSHRDIESLLQYIKRTEKRVGYLWQSPYNLTLLVLLWTMKPAVVNKITTEPELHWEMLLLYIEKLEERLQKHHLTQHLSSSELKHKIEQFLYSLYEEALSALAKDEVTLDQSAYDRLEKRCRDLSVPVEEMVGMFLKQTTTNLGISYTFPHKGILDFMGARYILKNLTVDPIASGKLMKVFRDERRYISRRAGSTVIRKLLKTAEESKKIEITKYQNLLKHLLGMFYLDKKSLNEIAKKEALNLLQQTGVKDRKQWLSVLADVKCDRYVASFIRVQPGILDKETEIDDDCVFSYISLLQSLESPLGDAPSVNIKINIKKENTEMSELFDEINKKNLHVCMISDYHAFRNPTPSSSTSSSSSQMPANPIVELMNRCRVEMYRGSFHDGMQLPNEVRFPQVSVSTIRDYESLCQELNKKRLNGLNLCVSWDLKAEDLSPIPGEFSTLLYLPDINDVSEAANKVKALMPITGFRKGEFWNLLFPRCKMKLREILHLMEELRQAKVRVSWSLVFPSLCKGDEEDIRDQIQEIAQHDLKARYGVEWGFGDIDDW